MSLDDWQRAGFCKEGTLEEVRRMLRAGVPPGQIILDPSRGGWIRVREDGVVHSHTYSGGEARLLAIGIVEQIIHDLQDRRGLGDEFNQVDDDVQGEIVATWVGIVEDALLQLVRDGNLRLGG